MSSTPSALQILDRGVVTRRQPDTPTAVAAGPRLARAGGDVLCSVMLQSELGINDFVPHLMRSGDAGRTWTDPAPLWPHLADAWSIFGQIGTGQGDDLHFFGARYRIDRPGESFWSDATQGLKQNELVWSRSGDGGRTWADPAPFAMAIPGSAEAPGPMCVTSTGRWIVCYAPYNTFDADVAVERNQLAGMFSDDQGRTWRYRPIMRLEEGTGAAEAWVVELTDGRLLATCWHIDQSAGKRDLPNRYAISTDGGDTWQPSRSTGILGHTTALTPLPHGRAIFLYVQRVEGPIGVFAAIVRIGEDGSFNVESDQPLWLAQKVRQSDAVDATHDTWEDFSFGEPACIMLDGRTLLTVLWCIQPELRGVAWVRSQFVETIA